MLWHSAPEPPMRSRAFHLTLLVLLLAATLFAPAALARPRKPAPRHTAAKSHHTAPKSHRMNNRSRHASTKSGHSTRRTSHSSGRRTSTRFLAPSL